MKTLIVIAHPNLNNSKVNANWLKELKKYPKEFTLHNLYDETDSSNNFDIIKEQKLIEDHDHLVLQFPIYWFSCPPLMKKWLDDVFLEGWAYGNTNKMKNRDVRMLVTAGIKESSYSKNGRSKHTLTEILLPFDITFNYMQAHYKGFYAFYSAEYESTSTRIANSRPEMLKFLRKKL